MRERKSLQFTISVKRYVRTDDQGQPTKIVPDVNIPDGAMENLEPKELDAIRRVVTNAFEVDSLPELIAETQQHKQDEYKLGSVTITSDKVKFNKHGRFT